MDLHKIYPTKTYNTVGAAIVYSNFIFTFKNTKVTKPTLNIGLALEHSRISFICRKSRYWSLTC